MAYFRTGYSLGEFLLNGFEVETPGAFLGAIIGLASSAILFEGLRIVRNFLLNRFTDARKQSLAFAMRSKTGSVRYSRTMRTASGGQLNEQETHSLQDGNTIHQNEDYEDKVNDIVRRTRLVALNTAPYNCTLTHILQNTNGRKVRYQDLIMSTILHMLYISIGYILMLAVMTFNVWVLVSISIGIAIGYFVFGTWRRVDHNGDSTLLTSSGATSYREVSSEKTGSTNSDSGNSTDGRTNYKASSSAQITASVDVHCSKLVEA